MLTFNRVIIDRSWANLFQSVQINMMPVLPSHSRPSEHPLASLFIMTFARYGPGEPSVNFVSISAR